MRRYLIILLILFPGYLKGHNRLKNNIEISICSNIEISDVHQIIKMEITNNSDEDIYLYDPTYWRSSKLYLIINDTINSLPKVRINPNYGNNKILAKAREVITLVYKYNIQQLYNLNNLKQQNIKYFIIYNNDIFYSNLKAPCKIKSNILSLNL